MERWYYLRYYCCCLLPCCARAYFTNDRLLLLWPLNSIEDSRSSGTMIAMAPIETHRFFSVG